GFSPVFQWFQIARSTCTYSRMRGAGGVHGAENRRSLCARTCDPSPTTKRPPVEPARSHPVSATAIGVRAKAIATEVCSSILSVAAPATASARNGSCLFSIVTMPSYPSASAARAASGTRRRFSCGTVVEMRMVPPMTSVPDRAIVGGARQGGIDAEERRGRGRGDGVSVFRRRRLLALGRSVRGRRDRLDLADRPADEPDAVPRMHERDGGAGREDAADQVRRQRAVAG